MQKALYESTLSSLPLVARGKVRDMYAVGDDKLLIIASDRISAFDVVFDDPIPGKGAVLTSMTEFWLKKMAHIIPNHATTVNPVDVVANNERHMVAGRAVVVKRLKPILVEAVARGYLTGSAWKDYQRSGSVCGIKLPAGLQQSSKLAEPIFAPAAKAEAGLHDENVDFAHVVGEVGEGMAAEIRDVTLLLYREAADYAATRGIIIADTKFEFGLDEDGVLHLMDEVLTPDSSRFWDAEAYQPGISPTSFDKQFLRDWLETQDWDKTPPAPRLPAEVIKLTAQKYQEALQRLVG